MHNHLVNGLYPIAWELKKVEVQSNWLLFRAYIRISRNFLLKFPPLAIFVIRQQPY